jgi:hypothetical protein
MARADLREDADELAEPLTVPSSERLVAQAVALAGEPEGQRSR